MKKRNSLACFIFILVCLYALGQIHAAEEGALKNSDFARQLISWEPTGDIIHDSSVGYSAAGSVKMTRDEVTRQTTILAQSVDVEIIPNGVYALSCWAKGLQKVRVDLQIKWVNKNGDRVGSYTAQQVGTGWVQIRQEAQAPSEAIGAKVYLKLASYGTVWLDDVTFELSRIEQVQTENVSPIPQELMIVDQNGGKEITIEDFILNKPNARWQSGYMSYHALDSLGFYQMECLGDGTRFYSESINTIPIKPNREYLLSLLINTSFDMDSEIDIGIDLKDEKGNTLLRNTNGVPHQTNGWIRYEYRFTSYVIGGRGRFYISLASRTSEIPNFRIADLTIVELPEKKLIPFVKGEGVTFKGGPGALPMKVSPPIKKGNLIKVETTGVLFIFDTSQNTISARQLLEQNRPVAVWESSLSFKELEVIKFNDKECILANDNITIGIQCDSLIMISPQKELTLTCEGLIGGNWNRLLSGQLLLIDDFGGITVNPDIPLGTGRLPRYKWLSGKMEKPGWKASWTISPGERLGITVFPPRPFDWRESFEFVYGITQPTHDIARYKKTAEYVDTLLLWNRFYHAGNGMTYGEYEVKDSADYLRRVMAIKEAGMHPIAYMSPYFYYSHDHNQFLEQVKKLKDNYGIEGVYYDGVYSQDWVKAYEIMRMTRELFPDGKIVLHTTGRVHNGGAPLARYDIFIPVIDTYATATLRGEGVVGAGKLWDYPKYITSQYRKANCIGIQKGDGWVDIPQLQQDLINLQYNGRARTIIYSNGDVESPFTDIYYPILKQLEDLWKQKGDRPDFYEQYYLPEALSLIENQVSNTGK